MNKDITYYLPNFFETELRSNDNCSENTIISYLKKDLDMNKN